MASAVTVGAAVPWSAAAASALSVTVAASAEARRLPLRLPENERAAVLLDCGPGTRSWVP